MDDGFDVILMGGDQVAPPFVDLTKETFKSLKDPDIYIIPMLPFPQATG
jgi:hypothetical protein